MNTVEMDYNTYSPLIVVYAPLGRFALFNCPVYLDHGK